MSVTDTITRPVTREDFDTDVREKIGDDEPDYSGWYCIATSPFPCPAAGCDFVAHYMTAAHLIVVWPRIDDRKLLSYARDARNLGRNPRVLEWQPSFGPCIAYDVWARIGRPVHGKMTRPEGVPFQAL